MERAPVPAARVEAAVPTQSATLAWDVLPASADHAAAQFTGLEQCASLPGPWFNVVTFTVPPSPAVQTFTVTTTTTNQACAFWRAYTR